jgi:predicted RNA-binding Zn-ribbon protein involved in translation (DUF1610 family)
MDSNPGDGSLTLLMQKNSQEMFIYPSLDKMLSIKLEGLVEILDFFTSKKFMTKRHIETLKFCPACFSFGVLPVERCRYCGMPSTSRGRVIEHVSCGFKNVESLFRSNGDFKCPRCGQLLAEEGKDYLKNGIMYKCQSCGNLYETPIVDYHCDKCGEYFPTGELGETLLYKYEPENEKMQMAKSIFKTLEWLQGFLGERGYIVNKAKTVTGLSGVAYDTDLYFTTPNDEDSIIVQTFMFDEAITVDDILKLESLRSDLNLNKVLIVSCAKIDEKAETLAGHYKMTLINPEKNDKLTNEKIAQQFINGGIKPIINQ